jgi:hypothetical protein
MPWSYIHRLLGPGLHWNRTQEELISAIRKAQQDGQHDAAHHIEIILGLRNVVRVEKSRLIEDLPSLRNKT